MSVDATDPTTGLDSQSSEQKWWLAVNGQPEGPYGEAFITAGVRTGTLSAETQACPVGGQEWQPLPAWPPWQHVALGHGAQLPRPHSESLYEFPLTNPQLPPMANWICVYTILISPGLWLMYRFSCGIAGWDFHEESRLLGFEMLIALAGFLFSTAVTALLLLGGLRLRALRHSGVRLIRAGIWGSVGFGVLAVLLFLALALSAEEGDWAEDTAAGGVVAFLSLSVGAFEFVFMLIALVWLHRYGDVLPLTDD